jgi:hypothetical protein
MKAVYPAENRTGYFNSTSLEYYRYTILFLVLVVCFKVLSYNEEKATEMGWRNG